MGAKNMFAVVKDGYYWAFELQDWFPSLDGKCMTHYQDIAESIAKREDAKVAIVQVNVTLTYTPKDREHM